MELPNLRKQNARTGSEPAGRFMSLQARVHRLGCPDSGEMDNCSGKGPSPAQDDNHQGHRQICRDTCLEKLKPVKEKKTEDARLVVDLYTDTNSKVTYYASRHRISTADDTMKHEVDRSFREKIRSLFK